MSFVQSFTSELPGIRLVDRNDKDFASRSKIYNTAVEAKPIAVAVPKTAEDVATIVKWANRTGAPISVRAGGHELFGRSVVQDGIVIDLRSLDSIKVDKDGGKAVIGGGVCSGALSSALTNHGCTTPCPNINSVGYIGYATTGGYGPLAHKFGLGVDHLLAARVVTADGEIVNADDDVMKGIRGAVGNFGIVVEATIKIYPFSEVLAGMIIFESSDYHVAMNHVQDGMNALMAANDYPPELDVQPMYGYSPHGPFYGAIFTWGGPDIERGRKYHNKVLGFHPVVTDSVQAITMSKAVELWAPIVPETSYVNARAVNVRRLTPKIYEILVDACATIPQDFAAMLTWHEVRPCCPSFDPSKSLPSVFNARESHYVIEILANAVDPAKFEAVSAWGIALRDRLVREAPEQLLNAQWLSSTKTADLGSLEDLYGEENAKFLRKLKAEKDPKGVFRHALPSFDSIGAKAVNGKEVNGNHV